jgi:hypothetical protein
MKACSVKLLVSAALSFLLSGCLFSNAPLITAANSDRPLPAHFLIAPDDKPGDSAEVDRADDNGYILHYPATGAGQSAAFPDEKLYFKKITDNIYAISRPIIEDNALRGYIYGYLRIIDAGKVTVHWPDCETLDPDRIKALGVEVTKDGVTTSCEIPSIDALMTLLRNYLDDPKNAETIQSHETESTFRITAK